MAEPNGDYAGLDSRLRDALGQAAQQGDSAGVADAIRSRVAAGDPGASAAASTAPGWGGGVFSWLPWVGLIVVAGLAGGAVGGSGVLTPAPTSFETVAYPASIEQPVVGASCPAGPIVGGVDAGDRVLAVARSEDSGWLGVRDPADVSRVLWFASDVVVLDDGQADVAGLPVEACPELVVGPLREEPTPDPEPEPGPGPGPDPGPAPAPGDTTPPAIQQSAITGNGCGYEVQAIVSDNVGVTGVRVSWSGLSSGSNQPMTKSGGVWRYVYTAPDGSYGTVTFTITARDAAGNTTSTVVSRNDMGCIS